MMPKSNTRHGPGAPNGTDNQQRRCSDPGLAIPTLQVFEFTGLPGSGKSTILDSLRKRIHNPARLLFSRVALKQEFHSQSGMLLRFSSPTTVMAAIGALPRLHHRMWRYGTIAKGPSLHLLRQVSAIGRLAYAIDRVKHGRATHRAGATLLLDQGMIQAVASLSVPGTNALPDPAGLIMEMLRSRIDGLIFVDCSPRMAMHRIRQRHHGTSRFDREAQGNLGISELERMQSVVAQSRSAASCLGIPLLELSSKATAEENAATLAGWLIERQQLSDDDLIDFRSHPAKAS